MKLLWIKRSPQNNSHWTHSSRMLKSFDVKSANRRQFRQSERIFYFFFCFFYTAWYIQNEQKKLVKWKLWIFYSVLFSRWCKRENKNKANVYKTKWSERVKVKKRKIENTFIFYFSSFGLTEGAKKWKKIDAVQREECNIKSRSNAIKELPTERRKKQREKKNCFAFSKMHQCSSNIIDEDKVLDIYVKWEHEYVVRSFNGEKKETKTYRSNNKKKTNNNIHKVQCKHYLHWNYKQKEIKLGFMQPWRPEIHIPYNLILIEMWLWYQLQKAFHLT